MSPHPAFTLAWYIIYLLSAAVSAPVTGLRSKYALNMKVPEVLSFWLRMVSRVIPFSGLANGVAGAIVGLAVGFVLLAGLLIASQEFPVGNIDESIEEAPLASVLADKLRVVIRDVRLIPVDWDTRLDGLKENLPDNIPVSLPVTFPKGVSDTIPNLLPSINR